MTNSMIVNSAVGSGRAALLARTVTPAHMSPAVPDDDEIVYPVSSQSSDASTSPDFTEDKQANPVNIRHQDHYIENNDSTNNARGHSNSVPFQADFVLERGDAGSRKWTPLPSAQRLRPRGRGHRATKSEPPLPTPTAPREPKTKLQPVKESWADDVNGLEEQMNRVRIDGTPARLRSRPVTEASHIVESSTPSPREQRSQKKQKRGRKARGASVPGTLLPANNPGTTIHTAARSYPSPDLSPDTSPSPTKLITPGKSAIADSGSPDKKKPKKGKNKNRTKKNDATPQLAQSAPSTAPSTPRGLGMRSIVDDVSENGDVVLPPQSLLVQQTTEADRLLGIAYEEAVKFMNAFIENPDYYTSRASRLTFLQALIVELGIVSTAGPERTLPGSLSAAKALLKSHAFLNVKDYLALREQGLDALRSAMRPSRGALVRDLRGKNGRKAKLNWVKETGLNVLLVSCQY
ncbi:hypothetical protein ACEPAF_4766 [Sanghuangporus sanghuang]